MTMTLAAGSAGAAPAAPAAHASAALKWPVTRPGSKAERVFAIQYLLNQQINAKLATDGIYGPGRPRPSKPSRRRPSFRWTASWVP
jgi:hypothetical protein